MYALVLIAHSWLRYAVLGLGLWLIVLSARGLFASASWSARDEKLHKAFLGTLDTQLLLGLVLYFVLSPFSSVALSDFGTAMKNPQLRFWGVEHIATMLIAVVVAHAGRARSRRREGKLRFKSVLITQLAWLVLTLAAIPWPGLDIGRPLFRY